MRARASVRPTRASTAASGRTVGDAAVGPAERGFAMPAEWAPHRATWLAWPHNRTDWPGKFAPIPWVYGEIVRHLARRERVEILVQDAAVERAARRVLARADVDLGQVGLHRVRTDRVWTRDSGPLFVCRPDGERLAVSFRFNAWAKYPDCRHDQRVGEQVAKRAGVPCWQPAAPGGQPVVLEGGAIDVDGEGTLLATEECLLDAVQARNPGLSRAALERVLWGALGVRKVIWLGRGIAGDDTHGHVDDLARFVAPGRIVLATEPNARDANCAPLAENLERLAGATDAAGRRLEVIPLPMPAPLTFAGRRLPASYANFYIANQLVLVPTFNDPNDRVALALLGELFPGREVVGIHAVDLVWGLGALHCMTQQEPRGATLVRTSPCDAG
jgi:agmatine deiminase